MGIIIFLNVFLASGKEYCWHLNQKAANQDLILSFSFEIWFNWIIYLLY